MTTSTAIITTDTDAQDALGAVSGEFDGYRGRIALLSVAASGTLTDMFSFLGPVGDAELCTADVINIEVMEAAAMVEEGVVPQAPVLQLVG